MISRWRLKVRRWFFGWLEVFIDRASHWQNDHDICELCKEEVTSLICIGCERRHCHECTSGFYEDVDQCNLCRNDISPEEEAEMMCEAAENDPDTTFGQLHR